MSLPRPKALAAVFFALALCPSRALAGEYDAAIGKVGTGRCHQFTCSFFVIDAARRLGTGKDGVLFEISWRGWTAEYRDVPKGDPYKAKPVRTEKPERESVRLVYCSKRRPTLFTAPNGAWEAFALRVGDESAYSGAGHSAYTFYYAACHRFITDDAVSTKMARKLGYRFGLDEDQGEDGSAGETDPFAMLE